MQVSVLMNIEAKKKYEFLESISAIMDAHLRYFKLGYDLLSKIEPYIHQVLTYAQQSKESANIEQDKLEKRIQEFRTQAELINLQASVDVEPSASSDGIHVGGISSCKNTETIMQSSVNGETIKQGYLLKRSSNSRGVWKRRFFVLNSQGTLYCYGNDGIKAMGSHHYYTGSVENMGGVFSRFRSRHMRTSSLGEETLCCRSVDLRISAIKMDAEDTDLRLCFRIITPMKTYTLQAEKEADRMDWVNKITVVIASILNSDFLLQPYPGTKHLDKNDYAGGACDLLSPNNSHSLENKMKASVPKSVSVILRQIPGNDICAECSATEPDWASLNLGILLCIECSGVHRNLGVHISKVRSLTLDVKVWEPTILDLFNALGNAFCNSIWEGLHLRDAGRMDKSIASITSIRKPSPKDSIGCKEQYIYAKYVEKLLVIKDRAASENESQARSIWEAVKAQNLREVYRLIVTSEVDIINTTFDVVVGVDLYHHVFDAQESKFDNEKAKKKNYDPAICQRIIDANDPGMCLQGCSLLHLACHFDNPVMLELLIQFGADINLRDFHGRTALHHCISTRNNPFAKLLLRRGARPSIKDGGGLSALERAMEMGAITDEELFILLAEC
ncbi:ADP-ribosylation factor GTPase-activating protein AGD4-like isoform X2 [Mangifera indica]|uniref:ADP-ribosylation factor GTPase-activating protein AGD4-like isoform X2 n=1 Tax=Mangifera indica TaxID=29780 RepID=UPI001CF94739|nr:ADP-ribosylation factor GTPase-activating protein AGD4-like isoform X2 [Mangifera indica]